MSRSQGCERARLFQIDEELTLILHVKEGVGSAAYALSLGRALYQAAEESPLIPTL